MSESIILARCVQGPPVHGHPGGAGGVAAARAGETGRGRGESGAAEPQPPRHRQRGQRGVRGRGSLDGQRYGAVRQGDFHLELGDSRKYLLKTLTEYTFNTNILIFFVFWCLVTFQSIV